MHCKFILRFDPSPLKDGQLWMRPKQKKEKVQYSIAKLCALANSPDFFDYGIFKYGYYSNW